MKKKDIKRHLQDYSIFSKRSSTINHAFASALSIADNFDEELINTALNILGQDQDGDLLCAYCGKSAETWDHIKAVVNKSSFSGHGHQINNLIPSCKDCNSAKGNKEWNVFLQLKKLDTKERIDRITNYINHNYINTINLLQTDDFKDDMTEFNQIKEQIFELMKKGDEKAKVIREKIRQATTN